VPVDYLLISLVDLSVLTEDEAIWACLVNTNSQMPLELYDQLGAQLNDLHLTVKRRTPPVPMILVVVLTLTGRTLQLHPSFNETVAMVKLRIRFKDGTPIDQQRLVFEGKNLEDSRTLVDYNIFNESKIHLILRLKGGKPAIRLQSTNGQPISNVNVHLHLKSVWDIFEFLSETNKY
jgi:hypothetical protein